MGISVSLLELGGKNLMAAEYLLKASPQTVHWGYFISTLKPALTIKSGDVVTIEAVSGDPAEYEAGGIAPGLIPPELKEIWRVSKERGPGPHILTGPIYIEGAEPGDMLEVHIKEVKMRTSFGFNRHRHGAGLLPEDFPYERTKVLHLDLEKMVSEVAPGVFVPLRPFFGIMGVAPIPAMGKILSGPPGIHGGNLDNKELTEGSILYLPVHVKGALFSAGDGHAAQGDGEVNRTAIETSMTGTFQLFIRQGKRLKWPRAETPTHFITMGLHEDLDEAAKRAVQEMIDYLAETKGLSRDDAYMVCSVVVDLRVTQVVDEVKGIHAMLPKSIFERK